MKSNLTQWQVGAEGVYYPCGKTIDMLEAGVYLPRTSPQGPFLQAINLKSDNLLRFEDPTHTTIIGEIDKFWNLKPKYDKLGFLHNRALLMYGPPGSGKSCISKIVVSDVVDRGNVVINCDNLWDLIPVLNAIRKVESERQCLVLMEDIESIDGQNKLLSLLDGEDTVNNIAYLGTTNYLEKIPERILRPGRFDRKIAVPCPPTAGRKAFLEDKIDDEDVISHLTEVTDGLSFAHLRELLVGIYCLGQNPEDVLKRLKLKGAEDLNIKEERAVDEKVRSASITASTKNQIIATTNRYSNKIIASIKTKNQTKNKIIANIEKHGDFILASKLIHGDLEKVKKISKKLLDTSLDFLAKKHKVAKNQLDFIGLWSFPKILDKKPYPVFNIMDKDHPKYKSTIIYDLKY